MSNIDKNIVVDYLALDNIQSIKDRYKTSYERIRRVCKEVGVWNQEERTPYKRKHCKDPIKDIKENPFKDLNNPQTHYWLGLLATDGCITGNRIELSQSIDNQYIIEQFKIFIKGNLPISSCKDKRFNSTMCRVGFSCEETSNFLERIGITQQKTKTLIIKIPISWDFIRGVIDGDGCVYIGKTKTNKNICSISIGTASKHFGFQLYNFLKDNNIKCSFRENKKAFYTISIYSFINCKKVIPLIYKNIFPCIEQKYKKALKILNF